MQLNRYRNLVRASAIYDLAVTAAFVTPWTFHAVLDLLGKISLLPAFEPIHVLFANLLGSIVIVWSLLRIRDPQPIFGLFDSFSRGMFFTWQLYYLVAMNGSPIIWVFAIFELFFGVAQALGYWLLRKRQ